MSFLSKIFAKIRLSMLGLVLGGLLTMIGVIAYANGNATLNLAGFFYGIPLFLGGLALRTTELAPIAFTAITPPEVLQLRETEATITQNKILQDVTRYRYGQNAHLDEALKKLGLSRTDEEIPILEGLKEMAIEGKYSLILQFKSPFVSVEKWQEKEDKITRFFGPDIRVEITEREEDQIDLALIKV